MKLYLDTSVVAVQLFGRYTEKDRLRAGDTQTVFDGIDAERFEGIVSFYVLQELHLLSVDLAGETEPEQFSRQSILSLLQHRIGLFRLLNREERLLARRRFTIQDASDEPHVIAAIVSHCDAILTYDAHFASVKPVMPVYTPAEFLIAER